MRYSNARGGPQKVEGFSRNLHFFTIFCWTDRMPRTMMLIANKLSLLNLILLTMRPSGVDSYAATKSSNLRGVQEATIELKIQKQRRLPPHPHHSSTQSEWRGCLDLSESEREDIWPNGPSCDNDSDGDGDNNGDEKTDEEQNYEQTDDDNDDTDPYDDFSITKVSNQKKEGTYK